MMKKKVIIDCDTGTDDAIAIIAALGSHSIEVRAITTVCGNVDLEHTSQNTLNLIDALDFNIPVAKGADRPLFRDLDALRKSEEIQINQISTHGDTGLGNIELPKSKNKISQYNAVETIYREALSANGELELILIGPQTNLALALKVYPELKNLIKHIYFMGGAINGGNSTAVAEFNIFFDPEAAKIVLSSGIPLTMVGLDVTLKATISDENCEKIRKIKNNASSLVSDLLDFMRIRRDKYKGEDTVMHDALAIASICQPDILKTHKYFVDVECNGQYTYGHTYIQKNNRLSNNPANCNVATEVNVNAFVEWLIDCISNHQTQ